MMARNLIHPPAATGGRRVHFDTAILGLARRAPRTRKTPPDGASQCGEENAVDIKHIARLQFTRDGAAAEGEWTVTATARMRYREWVGRYGSDPTVMIRLIEETAGCECIRRTWTVRGEVEAPKSPQPGFGREYGCASQDLATPAAARRRRRSPVRRTISRPPRLS